MGMYLLFNFNNIKHFVKSTIASPKKQKNMTHSFKKILKQNKFLFLTLDT